MSLFNLPRTYGNIRRLQEIAGILAKHGFGHVLGQLRIAEYLPGRQRVQTLVGETLQGSAELSTPARMRLVLQELGATYIKLGQLLATRPDLIPPAFANEFTKLQDRVTPLPAETIRAQIETSLKRPMQDVFRSFDNHAIASGSIGQVHYAMLHDGREVVVKVKRPGTDAKVREDLELLRILARLAEDYFRDLEVLRPAMVVDEFSRLMERELDFVGEASYTGKFAALFADDPTLTVPKVYWEFVTRDTLVLDRMDGISLSNRAGLETRNINPRILAATLSKVFLRQFFVHGVFHADPHPGNILVHSADRIALIDFGQVGRLNDDLRRKLGMTVYALSQGDIDLIVDLYAEIGVFTEKTDLREFRTNLASMIDRYYGIPIDRLDIGAAFQEALSVARRHGILLPRDFVLLGKSFITVMSVVRQLDPSFRDDEVLRPFANEIFGNMISAKELTGRLGMYAYRLAGIVRRAPEDLRDLLEKARTGQLRWRMQHEGLEGLIAELDRVSNRLTVGIIVGAVTIGSSIVLAAGDATLGAWTLPWSGTEVPVSAITASIGFLAAMIMGLSLAWSILRSRRF